jgi:hypothetical protein
VEKIGRKMGPLASWALCLSTPKHNGKSGASHWISKLLEILGYYYIYISISTKKTCSGRIARCDAGETQ